MRIHRNKLLIKEYTQMRSANILAEVTNDILHQVMLGKKGTLRIHRTGVLNDHIFKKALFRFRTTNWYLLSVFG